MSKTTMPKKSITVEEQIGGASRELLGDLSESTLKNYHDWIKTYFQGSKRGIDGFTDVSQIKKYAYDVDAKIVTSTLSQNTKKNHYMAITHFLKVYKAPKKLVEFFSDRGVTLNKIVEKQYKENKPTEKQIERGLTWQSMSEKYEELVNKNTSNDFKEKRDIMDMVIIGANYLQPPLRSNISNMRIVDENEVDNDGVENLLVKRPNGNRYYLLRTYKTARTYNEVQVPITPKFNKLIDESLKHFPRNHLVTNLMKKPLTAVQYQGSLRRLLNGASVDDTRMNFVSHFFEQKRSETEVEKIASMMLTSADRLRTVYKKIRGNSDEPEEQDEPIKAPKQSYIPPSERTEMTPSEARTNRLAYLKENYQKNKEKISSQQKQNFEKKKEDIYRKRIIAQIKKDRLTGVNTVRKETIEKYKIDLNTV